MCDEKKLLKTIQIEVPLTQRPFNTIAHMLGTSEDEILSTLTRLKEQNVLRSIAGIFNAKLLGYQSNLVAFAVPEKSIEQAVRVINPLPGVSHNYLREGEYNIWFTLALPQEADFVAFVERCATQAGATKFNIFKADKMIKLSARFTEDDSINTSDIQFNIKTGESIEINETVKKTIQVLQHDLPLVSEPFRAIVNERKIPITVEEVLATGTRLRDAGVMRSYRAVVRHHTLGYVANAMTVWKDNGNAEHILQEFSKEHAISHLYIRSSLPHPWEYPIFAMVHAKSEEELADIIKRLHAIAETDYRSYRSLKEFKKERVKYFEDYTSS
ncbi:MAG: hypothetical protein N3F66_06460 [Spirochaetes bacterium]|nr:hypothetical protein [Spirochaetota bacterium]